MFCLRKQLLWTIVSVGLKGDLQHIKSRFIYSLQGCLRELKGRETTSPQEGTGTRSWKSVRTPSESHCFSQSLTQISPLSLSLNLCVFPLWNPYDENHGPRNIPVTGLSMEMTDSPSALIPREEILTGCVVIGSTLRPKVEARRVGTSCTKKNSKELLNIILWMNYF